MLAQQELERAQAEALKKQQELDAEERARQAILDAEQKVIDDVRRQEEEQKKQAGNWLARIRQEKLDREERAAKERAERQRRLKMLLDSDSEDDEKAFDYRGTTGDNLKDFLTKIENHV